MMYVRAVLEDVVHGRSDVLSVLDITTAVATLVRTGQLTQRHMRCLRRHVVGYTLDELLLDEPAAYTLLVQAYSLIAEQSGYTDEVFLQRSVGLFPMYRKIMPALRDKMLSLGRDLA